MPRPARTPSAAATTQRDHAYRALRRLLIVQKIPDGQRLREPEWAKRLGVNRMALREAFARLEAEGLIQRGPATGYIVPRVTERDVKEILQVRLVLECAAIDAICADGRNAPAALKPLRAACDDLERLIEKQYVLGTSEADRRFHEALIDLAGNTRLAMVYHRAPLPMIPSDIVGTSVWLDECRRTLSEHRQMLAAIEAGKPAAARALLRKHLKLRSMLPLKH